MPSASVQLLQICTGAKSRDRQEGCHLIDALSISAGRYSPSLGIWTEFKGDRGKEPIPGRTTSTASSRRRRTRLSNRFIPRRCR
jgi:hypothetical protein